MYRISILIVLIFLLFISCNDKPETINLEIDKFSKNISQEVILPPAWAFGILYGGYTNQQQTIDRIKNIKAHNYPVDAYWIDSWFWSFADGGDGPDKYIDFVADTIDFPDREAMWSFMEENNIKGGFWVWDAIQKTGNEQAFEDFESRGYFSDTYLNTNSWHNSGTSMAMNQEGGNEEGTLTGNIDFDNPEAAAYFKQRMKHFFDEGADFLKLDRTTNMATVRTMFEMSQEFGKETKGRGFMLSHAGGLEDPEFKRYPTRWTSDTRSDWTVENPNYEFNSWLPNVAFKENIKKYTDTENPIHTVPFLTNDTGGFALGISREYDEELYIRWMQFSIFTPIVELFSQPENPTSNLPWKYSERADSLFVEYSHLRMRLFPYIYSYAHRTRWDGENMLRLFPDRLFQYKFGDEFLVAPIYKQDEYQRDVYLPEGNWYNYWTLTQYTGDQVINVEAPIDKIPLFVRSGSIIPQREYAGSVEIGTNDVLTLNIYPGDNGSFVLYEDDGISNGYLEGEIARTLIEYEEYQDYIELTIHSTEGSYFGMKEDRIYILNFHQFPFEPSSIEIENDEAESEILDNENLVIESNIREQVIIRFRK